MRARWRRLRDENAPDAGFTLTELLVVMTLMVLIGGIVLAVTITGLHKQRQIQDRNDAASQGRTALQRTDRDIRGAEILSASNTRLVMRVAQPSVTRVMTYCVVGSNLDVHEDASGATPATDVCASTCPATGCKVLASNLVDTASYPVFNYDAKSNYTKSSSDSDNVNTSTCLDSTTNTYAVDCLSVVTVHLRLKPASLAGPIDISDQGTELRNQ